MWRRLAAVALSAVLAKELDGDIQKFYILRHPRGHEEVAVCSMICGE